MSTTRIIITGKNKDFPNTIRLPFGVGVDGSIATMSVRVAPNQRKCRSCGGWGTIETWDGNPSHRDMSVRCTDCDGEGIQTMALADV